ncbi:MAG: glycosyl hydrolase family 92 [Planctomycetaceae bacterium]|nr:glycosyl hydrolase family 92 [Planctomycetaceae bacterium]
MLNLIMNPKQSTRVLSLICILTISQFQVTGTLAGDAQKPNPSIQPGPSGKDVNPFIGTGGVVYLCGNNFPGATVPFGMVRLSPVTVSLVGGRASNSSGYYYSDPYLLGFSHTRLAGTGATDGGNFLVIPCTAETAKSQHRGLKRAYSHDLERAFPGYYGVALPGLGITAELTSTCRVGVHRYTFAAQQVPHILINVTSALGKGYSKSGEVRIIPETHEIEGSVRTFGTFSKRYGGLKTHFVARFNRPFHSFATRSGEVETPGQANAAGDDIGVNVGFQPGDASRVVEVKVGISYVSIANARANLEHEAGQANFDQVLPQAVALWEEKLSRIQIFGGTERQRVIFRTALYHSLQMPTTFQDVNGEYLGFDGKVHIAAGFNYYTDMSLWDTFRTVHPLFNLIARREQRDMLVSLVTMAEHGGYLPRWPSGGGYTGSMFGSPADIVIAESYLKGIRDFDAESAYRFMKKTALGPVPAGAPFSGRVGVEHYLKHEYCPADLMKKSVASTIEYSYADQSIARLAEALGHRDDALLFQKHGRFYKNLWNPQTQFFQPRDSQKKFLTEFQPELLTYLDISGRFTHGYVEGSAWQWRWGVPSDGAELVSLFKSREFFVQELEQFFTRSPAGAGVTPNGFYWQGNQPDLYAAYLFNFAQRPDLTQKWVRWILETKYGDRENGLDGNDDGGTLSAWYVLSSLGIFPTAGTDRYEITGPLWTRAEIQLQDKKLVIVADNSAPNHPYIQRVWLNDKLLDRHWIQHAEIAAGGTLRFEMGPEPAK